jgi:two-component system sensor histidine kinase DesK
MIRVLPRDGEHGWTPFVWLIYLSAYVLYPFWIPSRAAWIGILDIAGLAAFLALYFRGYWVDGRERVPIIAGLAGLGLVLAPLNPGALAFFVYASAFIGGALRGRAAAVWVGGLTLVGVATALATYSLQGWKTYLEPMLLASVALMTPIIGFVNLHYTETRRRDAALGLAQDEIARLATLAERDRIAADLHDLLGHTLSVIVLKAGLAAKLMSRDAARASVEIADVERISREALTEVRRAVHGFRAATLSDELVRARGVLASAGIALDVAADIVPAAGSIPDLRPEVERAAALILRECVTNVIRHSQATSCRIVVAHERTALRLEVRDNGIGASGATGSGIQGMRARAEEIGGVLEHDGGAGTTIRLTAPWPAAHEVPA